MLYFAALIQIDQTDCGKFNNSIYNFFQAHVQLADERVFIGPSSPIESYLNIPNILQAVRKTAADAVHPGYGFLSENFEFATVLVSKAYEISTNQ